MHMPMPLSVSKKRLLTHLTKRQRHVLDFIVNYIDENNFAPSYREIGEELGLHSPASVWEHIQNLKEKGYVQCDESARSVYPTQAVYEERGELRIPVLGEIQAGMPMTAYMDPDIMTFPGDLGLMKGRDYYALRVRGDSMIEEGIMPGDTVIAERDMEARDGDVVVALVNGEETTLKKIFREGQFVRLQPANPRMDPIYVRNVDVQGVVKAVFRKY